MGQLKVWNGVAWVPINVNWDHGGLTGLSDDDHSHYHTSARADTWLTGNISFTGHTGNQNNPHATTATQVGAPTVAQFTGHTGDATYHFTQSQISITSTQVSNFNEAVQDVVGAFAIFSNGVTGTYNGAANTFSFSGTNATTTSAGVASFSASQFQVTNGQVLVTGSFTGFTGYITSTTYTDEQAQDAVGNILTDTASVDFTYNDGANTISAAVLPAGVDHNSLQNYSASRHIDHSTIYVSGINGLTGYGTIDGNVYVGLGNTTVSPNTYGSATQVSVVTIDQQGRITNASNTTIDAPTVSSFTGHTGNTTIHFTQGQISIPSSQISDFTEAVQDVVGSVFTFSNGVLGTYNDAGNTLNLSGTYATTSSVGVASFSSTQFQVTNGQVLVTGAFTGFTGYQAAGTTYTNEDAQDAVGGILTDTASIDFTYNDGANTITADVLPAGVNHNALQNYVAAEHVNHSSVYVTGINGLTGKGTIDSNIFIGLGNTTVSPNTYGTATQVGTFTVDQQGRLTNATNTTIDAPTVSQFTGHTGNATVHYTQAQISITASQVSNFNESAQDTVAGMIAFVVGAGITGTYDDAGNLYNFSGINASTTTRGISSYSSTYFSVSNGAVSFLTGSLANVYSLSELSDVSNSLSTSNGSSIIYRTATNSYESYTAFTGMFVTGRFVSSSATLTGLGTVTVRYDGTNISFSGAGGGATLADDNYGDITVGGGGSTLTINNDVVDTNKLANMPAHTILANPNGTTADPEYVTDTNIISQILTGVILRDGSRSFHTTISVGALPTNDAHLTPKLYVDTQDTNNFNTLVSIAVATFQPLDATLTTISALTPTTDQYIYFTASDTATVGTSSSFGRAIFGASSISGSDITLVTTGFKTGFFNTTTTTVQKAIDKLDPAVWNMVWKTGSVGIGLDTVIRLDNSLRFPVSVSESPYAFKSVIFFQTTATADLKFVVTGDFLPVMYACNAWGVAPSGTSLATLQVNTVLTGALVPRTILGTITGTGILYLDGIVKAAPNATGWVYFAWGQNTSDGGPTNILSGSYMQWIRQY